MRAVAMAVLGLAMSLPVAAQQHAQAGGPAMMMEMPELPDLSSLPGFDELNQVATGPR